MVQLNQTDRKLSFFIPLASFHSVPLSIRFENVGSRFGRLFVGAVFKCVFPFHSGAHEPTKRRRGEVGTTARRAARGRTEQDGRSTHPSRSTRQKGKKATCDLQQTETGTDNLSIPLVLVARSLCCR